MAVVCTLAVAKLPTLPDETRDILLCLLPFIRNKTDTELVMLYRELITSYSRKISKVSMIVQTLN